jgi:hypothetical protein
MLREAAGTYDVLAEGRVGERHDRLERVRSTSVRHDGNIVGGSHRSDFDEFRQSPQREIQETRMSASAVRSQR